MKIEKLKAEIRKEIKDPRRQYENRPPRKLKTSLKINNTTNKIKAKEMTFSTIAVFIRQNFKDFNFSINIFNKNTVM